MSKKKVQEKGKTSKALSELNTKEEHQFSTHVYKADGPTFYTRSKIQCLLRGRKYHNSILKQSIILLNVYRDTLVRGMCWMFYMKLGHSTLSKDVVQQSGKPGSRVVEAEKSFLSSIQLQGEISHCLSGTSFGHLMNGDFLRLTTIPLSRDLHNSAHKAIKTIGRDELKGFLFKKVPYAPPIKTHVPPNLYHPLYYPYANANANVLQNPAPAGLLCLSKSVAV